MSKTNAETMTVRLPTQIAKELIKLRDDENLPTIGSAIMVYLQKAKDDRIEKQIKKILNRLDSLDLKMRRGTKGATEEHIT